jgi:hypothetical protein
MYYRIANFSTSLVEIIQANLDFPRAAQELDLQKIWCCFKIPYPHMDPHAVVDYDVPNKHGRVWV